MRFEGELGFWILQIDYQGLFRLYILGCGKY